MLSRMQKNYLLNSTAKINISHGAVRSGKTFITNLRWLDYIRNGPPGRLLMSGRTTTTLKDNVLNDIFAMIGEANYSFKESTGELIIFGRKIKCVGAEKIDAEARIRGQTYAGWYGDEITIQHKDFVKQAITRCSVSQAKIFWTTNPDHPKHFIKTDFIDSERMKNMVRAWLFSLDDNASLTKDYIDLLRASFSGVFYSRNIKGLWVVADGLVYANYADNQEKHNISAKEVDRMLKDNEFIDFIAGTDWGMTAPMTGLIYGVTRDWKYVQIAEYYKTGQLTHHLGDWYIEQQKKLGRVMNHIYCDSAEPDRIQTFRNMGLRARASNKEINAGLNTVMTLFDAGRLLICAERCPSTVGELLMYRFPDPDDTKFKEDKPLDADNHALDGKRYALHNYERRYGRYRKMVVQTD